MANGQNRTGIASDGDNRAAISEVIEQNSDELRHSLRLYALRSGLAHPGNAEQIADELLNEVAVEALAHADRFDPTRHAMSWLLGIGANMIKRRIADVSRREQREPLVQDLFKESGATVSESELFERVSALSQTPETDLEREQAISSLLEGLSAEDETIIRAAILLEMDGALLAKHLGVRAGAARMRLHRALRRLRQLHGVE
jgi:RNA polymerase sigma-70 factor (ECF subfamily)